MSIGYAQLLTVSGRQEELAQLLTECFKLNEAGRPTDIDFEKISPVPDGLPDDSVYGALGSHVDVGVEALMRKPRTIQFENDRSYEAQSVLYDKTAKKLGLKSHDDLLKWVQTKLPEALIIGQAAIEAHAATGHWSAQEWKHVHWGGWRHEHFETESFRKTGFKIRIYSLDCPLGPTVRTMGQRFPSLNFRLAAIDDSGDCSYLAICKKGRFTEPMVEATEEFVLEAEGQEAEESDFYTKPAVITRQPMLLPAYWLRKLRLKMALAKYPVYAPPFVGLPSNLSRAQAQANYDHFLATRDARLRQLRSFLNGFNVTLDSSDSGLQALDRWIRKYGALLMAWERGASFYTHMPLWDGPRRGQNVIFDLATFIGDVIIQRDPEYHWELYAPKASGRRKDSETYQSPVICGADRSALWRVWIFTSARQLFSGLQRYSVMWRWPNSHDRTDWMQTVASDIVANAIVSAEHHRSGESKRSPD